MYPNPVLDAELAKEHQANLRASFARAQNLKQRHPKSALWKLMLTMLFG